jgi:hypothetical protein
MSSDYTIELTALKGRRRNYNKGIHMSISRRRLVLGLGAAAIAVRATEAAGLLPTPQETFGPYFPVVRRATMILISREFPDVPAAPWARSLRFPDAWSGWMVHR